MSSNPVFKPGNTAVITGGASGIGLALATKCAGYDMNVVIVDNSSSNLYAAKKAIKGKVDTVEMDVSKIEDFERLKGKIEKDFGGMLLSLLPMPTPMFGEANSQNNAAVANLYCLKGKISFLSLNAGIGLRGSWPDTSYFHQIMNVNLFGVIHGLNTLLPLVISHSTASSPSSIVITGSKQGITNPPGNPAYNASKAAVKTLAEHLSFDLSKSSPTTSVHLLIPGWTFTGLSGNEPFGEKKEKPKGAWTGEQVIEYLENKMEEGKFYVVCPDNDVSEEMDRKRMLWGAMDLVEGRPPLTRWREDWQVEAEEWMAKQKV
jgi:NAD(P)-dependent dehydrogenase (short-subunit alcohol dehydrogenase family)